MWSFEFHAPFLDMGKMVRRAAEVLETDFFPVECEIDDEEVESDVIYALPGKTTQGVRLTKEIDDEYILTVHSLSTRAEIEFAFELMRLLYEEEEVEVMCGDDAVDLTDEAMDEMWDACLENMVRFLVHDDSFMVVEGVFETYRIYGRFLKDKYPGLDRRSLAIAAMDDFTSLQTAALLLERFGGASITSQEGEEHKAMVIYNRDGIGTVEERFILQTTSGVKLTTPHDFFETCAGCECISRIDAVTFIMKQMPKDEWDAICIAVPGDFLSEPRTFLLRWNPAISSFRLDEYEDVLTRFKGEWQMDWSVRDWKEARKGDRFFMLREGDGVNPGIIFRGLFASDPYEDDDWRGTDTKRHYVEIECWDARRPDEAPWITPEELDDYDPGPDWRNGHSGELLTPEQANRLEGLWHHAKTNQDGNKEQ